MKTSFEIIWEFLAPAEQFLNRREACERLWKGLPLKKQRQIYATFVWQKILISPSPIAIRGRSITTGRTWVCRTTQSCLLPSTANITEFIANSIRKLLRWKTGGSLIDNLKNYADSVYTPQKTHCPVLVFRVPQPLHNVFAGVHTISLAERRL